MEAEGNGTIRGEGDFACIGGIAGKANVEITHCYATVNVEVTNNRAARIGGHCRRNGGPTISYTYATGKIKLAVRVL